LAHCWVLRQQDRGLSVALVAGGFPGLFVSGFLAAPIAHVDVWGVWFGVVV
jgi:hypothetical protein